MSLVYYKFKSAKDHNHITFDGTGISVFDLKKEIMLAKRLGKGTEFDLSLYNPHNDEGGGKDLSDAHRYTMLNIFTTPVEYRDDNTVIPRASSVIVRRHPPVAPGKGLAQRYVGGGPITVGRNEGGGHGAPAGPGGPGGAQTGGGGGGGGGFRGGGGGGGRDAGGAASKRYVNYYDRQNETASAEGAHGSMGPGADGAGRGGEGAGAPAPGSEEAKLQGFFQTSSDQWQHQQEQMADASPVGGPGGAQPRRRPPVGGAFERAPPPSYICYRCGQAGHFIQNCPTNGDKTFDKPRIRRTTGIPRSFLRAVDVAPEDREGGVMVTPDGGLVVAAPDSQAWNRITARNKAVLQAGEEETMEVPPELACTHVRPSDGGRRHLLREAVLTPCCRTKYCDECLREELLSHHFRCPSCGTPDQSPDNLRPDQATRSAVDAFLRAYTARKVGGPSHGNQPAPAPSAQHIPSIIGSGTQEDHRAPHLRQGHGRPPFPGGHNGYGPPPGISDPMR